MTRVLDISVPPGLLQWVAVATTSRGAEQACEQELTPFDGWIPARAVLHLPGETPLAGFAGCDPMPVPEALMTRGALLVNRAGRVGVCIDYHRVVQPAGRAYALADTDEAWWVAAWRPRSVLRTMNGGIPGPVRNARGHPVKPIFNRHGEADSVTVFRSGAAGGSTHAGLVESSWVLVAAGVGVRP